MIFLGFDTSNYTTSAAAFCDVSGEVFCVKRLLDVKPGELGLRQSDALFAHVQRVPDLAAQLFKRLPNRNIAAVAASTRPRDVDGSYMPCFLAGEGHARVLASAFDTPFFAVSHQQNHVAAAAWSAGRFDLLDAPHLAFHVSGGTTELLYVTPDTLPNCVPIDGTADLAAGQIIDRCGVRMKLSFPAGPEMETLALQAPEQIPFLPRKAQDGFSLSGLENKFAALLDSGAEHTVVARFVLDSLAAVLIRAATNARDTYPKLPLLCAGGVMCNSIIRAAFERELDDVYFAKPELSSDNAVGTALLAARLYEKGVAL